MTNQSPRAILKNIATDMVYDQTRGDADINVNLCAAFLRQKSSGRHLQCTRSPVIEIGGHAWCYFHKSVIIMRARLRAKEFSLQNEMKAIISEIE